MDQITLVLIIGALALGLGYLSERRRRRSGKNWGSGASADGSTGGDGGWDSGCDGGGDGGGGD